MLASLLIPPLYNIGTTSVKSVLFQGAHTKDIKNPRMLFTNAEDLFIEANFRLCLGCLLPSHQ